MNILQDIIGLFKRKKLASPKDKDVLYVARNFSEKKQLEPIPQLKSELIQLKDLKTWINAGAPSTGLYGLFSQTAQGPTITNTTTESDVLGTGVGTLSIPANGFKVGDAFHAKVGGTISAQNGDDITIRVKNGATVLASTGVITLSPVSSLAWEIEIDFTIRTIGATGQIFTNGNFAYNRNTGSLEGFVFSDTQTIDTTVASTLMITVEWGQAKTQDIIFTDMTTLYKIY